MALCKKIALVSTITLCYNLRADSIMTSALSKKRTDRNANDLCDVIIRYRELIESKFPNVQGAYDFYYKIILRSFVFLVALFTDEEHVKYIKSQLKNSARKVPSIRCLHSTRFRFIYLCSCIYDNGYSFYHYDTWYSKLQSYFPKLLKG